LIADAKDERARQFDQRLNSEPFSPEMNAYDQGLVIGEFVP
jgi:hypothetical protein